MTNTKVYRTWVNMKNRCHNPREPRYPDYGGRGIVVCETWRDDFAAFYAHIGDPPSPDHSIDRLDNDNGYEPGNVRWATVAEQSANRKRTELAENEQRPKIYTAQVPLRVTPTQKALLRRLAEMRDRRIGYLIRQEIRALLKREFGTDGEDEADKP